MRIHDSGLKWRLSRASLAALSVATLCAAVVRAQESPDAYPSRPVTLVIPSAGSSPDVEFRLYNQSILDSSGRQFVIDYKGGAAGTIGAAYVAKAVPDGYTLYAATSEFSTAPFMYKNLPYGISDFAPVTLMTKHIFLLVVHPSAPFRSARDYIDYARTHPGEINWGDAGQGNSSNMPGELLHSMTRTKVVFIHYKTAGQRLLDLMAGRIHATAVTPVTGMTYVKAGKLRALAVTSSQRSRLAPDLPTLEEEGVPGYEFTSWVGLVAPARTPPSLVNKLNAMFVNAGKDPNVARKIEADGTILVNNSVEQFARFIDTENKRWGKVIREAGIKVEE